MVLDIIAIIVSILTPLAAFLGSWLIFRKQKETDQKNQDFDISMKLANKSPEEVQEIMKNMQAAFDVVKLGRELNDVKKKIK